MVRWREVGRACGVPPMGAMPACVHCEQAHAMPADIAAQLREMPGNQVSGGRGLGSLRSCWLAGWLRAACRTLVRGPLVSPLLAPSAPLAGYHTSRM
jgi:hypothetical protein